MIFRRILALGFLAFLLFGLLGFVGMAGRARTESAWMQGYLAGQQAAAGEDGAAANQPYTGPGMYGYGRYSPHFHGYGRFFPGFGFFTCLIPLFLFGGFLFMAGRRRRHWHRHGHGPWRHHPHGSWGHGPGQPGFHKPPWVDDDDLADEPVMKA